MSQKLVGRIDELRGLIDEYWGLAYREGAEGRNTDTPEGDAQRVSSEIDASIRAIRQALAEVARLHARHEADSAYIKKMDGIIEEVGGVTASCINPYEDLKRALQGQKSRAETAEQALAANPSHCVEEPSPRTGVDERAEAEQAYTISAFNYVRDPVGSERWCQYWNGWQARAALSHKAGGE